MSAHVGDPNMPNPECPCVVCSALRYVQEEVARTSPWCGTCNPEAMTLMTGSPEYRRWFEQQVREGGDMDGIPVPASLDPTVKP